MLERMFAGELAEKHHVALRGPDGALRYEECFTRQGFDGPYTILYHRHRPQALSSAHVAGGWEIPREVPPRPLAKRLYQSLQMGRAGGPPSSARVPLLFNADLVVSMLFPTEEDGAYFSNGDADELYYIHEGEGLLRSALGDLPFSSGDYVYIPKGMFHRFLPSRQGRQMWLSIECFGGLNFPSQYRNGAGQLRMDAPYCHRDFRRPTFKGPTDEGIRKLLVKRGNAFHGFQWAHAPLDVVGWDGTVYPFAFPILRFQPKVGQTHLPPIWHGTFSARGALVCSFVPRPLDFHPDAVPCPYPHSSVDCDEVIFYAAGSFTSRRGVGPGSLSHHPAGVTHGPHPGAYEGSLGARATDELAVMLDTYLPLQPTAAALAIEDAGYQDSFL